MLGSFLGSAFMSVNSSVSNPHPQNCFVGFALGTSFGQDAVQQTGLFSVHLVHKLPCMPNGLFPPWDSWGFSGQYLSASVFWRAWRGEVMPASYLALGNWVCAVLKEYNIVSCLFILRYQAWKAWLSFCLACTVEMRPVVCFLFCQS